MEENKNILNVPDSNESDDISFKMKPGVISLTGFLGNDSRSVHEIMGEDDKKVREMGLDHKIIASKMEHFRNCAIDGLGCDVEIEPHFRVKVDGVRGRIPCPFGEPGVFAKFNTNVTNIAKNRSITFSDLNIHLVKSHGFYQGKGSTYRLEPEELVDTLEI
jgi:hypothetical protein